MEMNNFRGESHVAQQSRRDKLRVHQQPSSEHLENHYTNNLKQLSFHHGLNPDLIQLRNLKYGTISYDHPPVFSSEMLNYATKNSQVLLPQNNALVSADNVTIARVSGDPHNCSNCDWNVDTYFSNATSIHESNPNPMFAGGEGGGSDSFNVNSNFSSSLYMRQPNCYGYQDVLQSSLVDNPVGDNSIIHQNRQKHFGEMQQCSSSASFNYQNTLQEVGNSAGNQGIGMARFGKYSNELVLLPSFGDHQSNHLRVGNTLVDRPIEAYRHWDGEGLAKQTFRDWMRTGDSSNTQSLSLSLSSVPTSKTREGLYGERIDLSDPLDSKALRPNYFGSSSRQSVGSKVFGYNHQNIQNAVSPLGPFTGYTTILKNSKYLKPTLQLLDELYGITGSKQIKTSETYSDEISEQVEVSRDAVNVSMAGAKVRESGASSSTFYNSNEISVEAGGRSSSSEYCYRPEYHQKKETLLYIQEEVCRSYKQYHQQMQMVVSSFESVAGLSAATPYISMALKTVLRHFSCLKNAISDQLRHMGKAVTEDLPFPTAGTSSNRKGDTSNSPLKFNDHGFQKHNSGGSNLIFEHQPPVWRPQRGLPERAVAVLRAWLFDHFLHPYPTDTDKHMLATHTGLTRNQVSNWFINARVRIWKPMVEEIHVLETKGLAEPSSQTVTTHENLALENASHQYENRQTNNLSGIDSLRSREGLSAELWNQEKRSRVECQIPGSMDEGSLMNILPDQQGGIEIGTGLGAVSLTLGLRQSAESVTQQQQQHQQLQQQETAAASTIAATRALSAAFWRSDDS